MKSRQLIILAGIALALGGCFANNYMASLKQSSKRQPPPPSVRSAQYIEVANTDIQAEVPITGKVVAKDKIEIYAEVSGTLMSSSSKFKEGNSFRSGEALVRMDNSELSLSLQSLKSNYLSLLTRVLPDLKLDYPEAFDKWKAYTDAFSVQKSLTDLPEVSGKEKYFLSTQGVFNQFYNIKSQEARLSKFTIYAPYSGALSQAMIKPGTLVRAGQKLGEFIKTGTYEIEVAIDLNYLRFVDEGSEVQLKSTQIDGSFKGDVKRISQALDPNTQSAKVIIELKSDVLIEGMYLTGSILTKPFEQAFALKKNQINDQDETFLIVDGKLLATSINPLFEGENEVIVSNLKDGDKVLSMIYSGAFDGAAINIGAPEKAEEVIEEASNL